MAHETSSGEAAALAALDAGALAADLARLVRVPSLTGDERGAVEAFAELAASSAWTRRSRARSRRAARPPGHPGEEAPRGELSARASRCPGAGAGAPVPQRAHRRRRARDRALAPDPFAAWSPDGRVHGRGALDMKAGVVAALHALAAVRARRRRRPPRSCCRRSRRRRTAAWARSPRSSATPASTPA